jgi:hypothetical protein
VHDGSQHTDSLATPLRRLSEPKVLEAKASSGTHGLLITQPIIRQPIQNIQTLLKPQQDFRISARDERSLYREEHQHSMRSSGSTSHYNMKEAEGLKQIQALKIARRGGIIALTHRPVKLTLFLTIIPKQMVRINRNQRLLPLLQHQRAPPINRRQHAPQHPEMFSTVTMVMQGHPTPRLDNTSDLERPVV